GNLADLLDESDFVQVIGQFTNPLEALEQLQDLQADIAFLDIEMPGISGMNLAKKMVELKASLKIVFVTAYSTYAIEAFTLNATDYLMKPVTLDRLKLTLERITSFPPSTVVESKLKVSCFGRFKVEDSTGRTLKWRTN